MEYQKIINLLDNTPHQPFKFKTENWVEFNDSLPGTDNTNRQINFKSWMLKSSLCGYSNECILVKGTITIGGRGADQAARQTDERDKAVIFKNCPSLTEFISEINNTQVDHAKNVVIPMFNLIKYSDNY